MGCFAIKMWTVKFTSVQGSWRFPRTSELRHSSSYILGNRKKRQGAEESKGRGKDKVLKVKRERRASVLMLKH